MFIDAIVGVILKGVHDVAESEQNNLQIECAVLCKQLEDMPGITKVEIINSCEIEVRSRKLGTFTLFRSKGWEIINLDKGALLKLLRGAV
jgi:hypothetical protein